MLRKIVIIDFDSSKIDVLANGILVKECPAAVVRKATENPVLIAYGEDALKMKHELSPSEVFCTPFKCGRIVDNIAAKVLFRAVLRELFGPIKLALNIFVIISGGLEKVEKRNIEKIFYSCGYRNITLIPRPKIFARLLGFNNLPCGLYMDTDLSEFILANGGKIISSATIDVSTSAFAEVLRNEFLSKNKLKLSLEDSLKIASKDCSLYAEDLSKVDLHGQDAITSSPRSVCCSSKDIYPIADRIYSKITSLIEAALLDANNAFAIHAVKTSFLLCGKGVHINGLKEYIYKKIGVNSIIDDDKALLLSVLYAIVRSEPEWIELNAE